MPKKPQTQSVIRKAQKVPQGENDIFALDIGTRNVVGIIGHTEDGVFVVTEAVSIPHKRRAMLDGQIEDIGETARVVKQVKTALEDKTGIALSRVAIAAAGRALKTRRASVESELDGKESITENMLKSLELEAVSKAQSELDKDSPEESISFYCVGHTVVKYTLDDYPIKSLIGHKGKKVMIELIAAFLPSLVVESLYTVMDMNGLDVCSLTLEPIAAMNVIIPPEVRLINIALVDIGAGTTDIAVSQNGSIVAYAMATTAGDEITEEIIQQYLVDFETAEIMKLTPPGEPVTFKDILGFEHTLESADFYGSLFPAEEQLANTIAENILEANGGAPAAVFLVGGGSLIPELTILVAEKLGIPENRVAIGGQATNKNISLGKVKASGPEFVTPIGIGITATLQKGYEFSQVTLNGSRIRIFDTKAVTAADLLMNAGYKTAQIIGKSGRGLIFTLNGEKQSIRGETSVPAEILANGSPVPLEYTVKQGDNIEFRPATIGVNAAVTVSDIAGEVSSKKIIIDGESYAFGRTARVNGTVVSGNYSVQNYDAIEIETIETLDELIMSLPFDCTRLNFYKGDRRLRGDYTLEENDYLTTKEKAAAPESATNAARDIALRDEKASRTVERLSGMPMSDPLKPAAPIYDSSAAAPAPVPVMAAPTPAPVAAQPVQPVQSAPVQPVAPAPAPVQPAAPAPAPVSTPVQPAASTVSTPLFAPRTAAPVQPASPVQPAPVQPETIQPAAEFFTERPPEWGDITITLNGKSTFLARHENRLPHDFLELMNIVDIDLGNPPPSGNMILTINGRNASFMDHIHSGDDIVIRWDV